MKRTLIGGLVGVFLLASAVWTQAQKAGGTEKAIEALEQQWLQGMQKNNPDLIAPLLADKIVNTEDDGKVHDKAQTLEMIKKTKYDSADNTDVKVTVFGGTAIATGGFKGKGTDASGKRFDVYVRWTDTWVKMPDGKWQCVATQVTPVKM
jgi:ketosteroid isomerase-like protein